jgi:hypothetical protein
MLKQGPILLLCSSMALPLASRAATYADSVVAYSPGTGFATEFGTGLGFTNAAAALGEPSRVTSGQFGGPVDPFNPPYLRDQIVSIGAGGSLTLGFSSPVSNDPSHPFGLDFNIFGNAGFVITNGNFSGGGITDGSLFGANSGQTRISVSADNVTYYQLDPSHAPTVDGLFPTDGSGNFALPVDPKLSSTSFSGLDLAGIRTLYNGSGGGTGFDISWAINSAGQSVSLPAIQYVRIDVLSGVAEIDGLAGIQAVPEPATWTLGVLGLILVSVCTFKKQSASANDGANGHGIRRKLLARSVTY